MVPGVLLETVRVRNRVEAEGAGLAGEPLATEVSQGAEVVSAASDGEQGFCCHDLYQLQPLHQDAQEEILLEQGGLLSSAVLLQEVSHKHHSRGEEVLQLLILLMDPDWESACACNSRGGGYFGNICCVSGDCRNTRSFQQQIFSDVKKRKTPCKCSLHGGLPFPRALPGEQLQHLRLGRAPQPPLGPPVVRGAQQARQGQARLQPPRPAPARLHALPAPLRAPAAPRARLHRGPARQEAATQGPARPGPAAQEPRPRPLPAQVPLRVGPRRAARE